MLRLSSQESTRRRGAIRAFLYERGCTAYTAFTYGLKALEKIQAQCGYALPTGRLIGAV